MALDLDKGGRIPQVHQTYLGPSLGWIYTDEPTDIEFLISASAGISPGLKGYLTCPNFLLLNSWTVLGNAAGSIVIDIWKVSLAQFLASGPPTAANSITALTPPTLVDQSAAQSFSFPLWTVQFAQNDVFAFNIKSVSGLARCTLVLNCIRAYGTF